MLRSKLNLTVKSQSQVPSALNTTLTFAPSLPDVMPEARVRRPGGEAGAARGHLLVVVWAVPGAGGIPPQAPPPIRRESKLPRPRQGMLRRHRRARAFQTVR